MDIEVRGATPVDDPPPPARVRWFRRRDARIVAMTAALGIALGFAVATVRDDRRAASDAAARASRAASSVASPTPADAPETALPAPLVAKMVDQVRTYNHAEAATVETSDVFLMTVLRHNLDRLDTARTYSAGDYRLQLICLGNGEIWALFRIGDDESHVDMDCHDDHVLVTQLLLTAKAGGQRAVTLVSDSTTGLAVGYQVLRTPAP